MKAVLYNEATGGARLALTSGRMITVGLASRLFPQNWRKKGGSRFLTYFLGV